MPGFVENTNLVANYIRGANENIFDEINFSVELAYKWAANPHNIEPDPDNHPQEYSAYSYTINARNIAQEMLDHDHDDKYWPRAEFVSVGGLNSAGKPAVLDHNGMFDASMVPISALNPIGPWTPTIDREYPDDTAFEPGSMWTIIGTDVDGYEFTTGDLVGQAAKDGDIMLLGSDNWVLRSGGEIDPGAYYRLDGALPITHNFQSGWKQLVNVADGTSDNHAATVGQMESHVDDNIEIGTFGTGSLIN